MGAKRVKAIACAGRAPINLAHKGLFSEIAKKQIDLLNESILKVGFESYGTNMVSDMVNIRGGYPTHNWQQGVFDQIEEVNGQALTDQVFIKGVSCFACPIACGRRTEIKEPAMNMAWILSARVLQLPLRWNVMKRVSLTRKLAGSLKSNSEMKSLSLIWFPKLPAEDYVDLIAIATGWNFGVDNFRRSAAT